jgi:hypothetical protein
LPADIRQTIQRATSTIEEIRTKANLSERTSSEGLSLLEKWFTGTGEGISLVSEPTSAAEAPAAKAEPRQESRTNGESQLTDEQESNQTSRNAVKGKPAKASRGQARNVGGRPRKWDELWNLIKEMDHQTPKPADRDIAAAYNKMYGSRIGEGPGRRKRATPTIVAQVRYERTKRLRKQNPQ